MNKLNNKLLTRIEISNILNINEMTLWKISKKDEDLPFIILKRRMLFDKDELLKHFSNIYIKEDLSLVQKSDILTTKQLSNYLRMTSTSLLKIIKSNEDFPFLKIGSRYRFISHIVFRYIQNKYKEKLNYGQLRQNF